jgi:hypothetical protein
MAFCPNSEIVLSTDTPLLRVSAILLTELDVDNRRRSCLAPALGLEGVRGNGYSVGDCGNGEACKSRDPGRGDVAISSRRRPDF